jgi:homoserine kinase type II
MWPKRIMPGHCAQLGAGMAQMHAAGAGFALTRANALSVAGWRTLFAECAPRAHEVHGEFASVIPRELDYLERAWPRDLPQGVIHADLFPDNVFFLHDRLSGLIDFYFACNDFLAYDIAICLNAWCFESDWSFNVTKANLLLVRYREVRALSPAEIAALPILARGAAMRFLLTRLYDWLNHPAGALVRRKDPMEYWQKLRFHQSVKGAGAYGLDL